MPSTIYFFLNYSLEINYKHYRIGSYFLITMFSALILVMQKFFKEICETTFLFLEKDVWRTDRCHKFFQGGDNPNITILNDILLTHCMYNFDLGWYIVLL